MRVADLVLIPLRPSFFDLKAAEGTLEMARALNREALTVLNAVPPSHSAPKRQLFGMRVPS